MPTFLFADLAGYTALTEAHGDERAADIAADFHGEVRAVLALHDADEVKSIGGAVMVVAREPHCAVEVARHLVSEVGARHGALGVRVGMHSGEAVERDGDWFGAAVNLAARVGEVAAAGEVLMTAATRAVAGSALEGLEVRPRGRRRFKNVGEPVELFALVENTSLELARLPVDPVCRMAVQPPGVARVHRGVEHHFCSVACADRFSAAPERYVGRRGTRMDLLVSEDARDRVTRRLARAYRRGRLSQEDMEDRIERALAARTRADLHAQTYDLPRRRQRALGPVGLTRRLWRRVRSRFRRRS